MKLAVSDLAWDKDEDAAAARMLSKLGVKFIELAPTRHWPVLSRVPATQARDLRRFWNDAGFDIVALQAILFGHPELTIFESDTVRSKTLDYLDGTFKLASQLGASVLVFGSPKNRLRGELSQGQAMDIAVPFFAAAGRRAADQGVILVMEPNAPQYNCDFVTTAAEGHELVARVKSPGFQLHLDAGCMTMAGDDPAAVVKYPPRHFHISAPNLGPVQAGAAAYDEFEAALRAIPYRNFVSIEMKPEASGNLERVTAAVKLSQSVFHP